MLYDQFFTDQNYSPSEPQKIETVREWIKTNHLKKVLDVGCGRGHYMKVIDGVEGLEPSKQTLKADLKGLKVTEADILSFSPKKKYDGLYCMDVLEHIEPSEIDANLEKLVTLAPTALYGIANHTDMQQGIEVHRIQEPAIWWYNKLLEYYDEVKIIQESYRFFVLEAVCSQ